MTEYWLQKKTIGGWSQVTWYVDEAQARDNYKRCVGNGMSGYSWRLVEVKEIEISMLQEVVETPIPNNTVEEPINTNAGWGQDKRIIKDNVWNGWSIPSDSSKHNPLEPKGAVLDNGVFVVAKEHGLTGSVWVINHLTRQKLRVSASELQKHLDNGFERGGPKTKFRE